MGMMIDPVIQDMGLGDHLDKTVVVFVEQSCSVEHFAKFEFEKKRYGVNSNETEHG